MTKQIKHILLASILGAGLGVPAVASAQQFDGLHIDLGIGFKSTDTRLLMSDSASPISSDIDMGKSRAFGSVAAGWNLCGGAACGNLGVDVGLFADLGSVNAGEAGFTDDVGTTTTMKLKQKSRWGVYVAPGFEFNPRTVAYFKLAWNQSRGEVSATTGGVGSGSFTKTFNGVGYGAGVKYLVNARTFVFAEWMQVDYKRKSETAGTETISFKPKNTLGLIGAGWQF